MSTCMSIFIFLHAGIFILGTRYSAEYGLAVDCINIKGHLTLEDHMQIPTLLSSSSLQNIVDHIPTMVLSTNYSIFSIPAMFVLSYYPAFKKISTLKEYKIFNNVAPRGNVAVAQANSEITPDVAARIARLEGAHNNGLENSPFFGLSVLAANYAGVEAHKLNIASGLYLLCRLIYNYIYINQTTPRVSGYRTVVWNISILFPFYLLFVAGLRLASK